MKENLVGIIFTVIGGLFTVVGLCITMQVFNPNDVKIDTKGVIKEIVTRRNSEGERVYDVIVEYDVDVSIYESELGSYNSTYDEGDVIDIYYYKDNPSKIGTRFNDKMMLMFPLMGCVFFILGIGIIITTTTKKKRDKFLQENGTCVNTTYVETVYNTHYSVNGLSPYYIVCRWTNSIDGKTYTFKSNNIWFNPELIIYENNITTIPVYIDESNPKKYFMDVEFLRNKITSITN